MRWVMLLVMLSLCYCSYEEEPSVLKVSINSNHTAVLVNNLFRLLIGRLPDEYERQQLIDDTQDKNRVKFYHNMLNKVLHSDAYHQEGFWHLHRDRLLLAPHGTTDFIENSQEDHTSLLLELSDVSYADDYWQLLKYRHRWLNITYLELNGCLNYMHKVTSSQGLEETSENEEPSWRRDCRVFLQASFDRAITHPFYYDYMDGRRFVNLYQPLCCPEIRRFRDACQGVENAYQQVFAENFCEVASREAPLVSKDNSVAWSDKKIQQAISVYVALRLSEKQPSFKTASVPKIELLFPVNRSGYYLKVKVPPLLQGIHANPFWLSQHPSSKKNRDLHRARLIYHSWFCESISPDNAKQTDPYPDVPAKFLPYFSNNDQHAKDFGSCFNCHKMVQPLANYFGLLTDGLNYQDPQLYSRTMPIAQRFFDFYTPMDMPGGFYDEKHGEFFPFGKQRGMEGLADLLSNMPRVHRCVVNSTWNGFFGHEWHLSASETKHAVANFKASNFNYRELLRYLLTTDKAITYFTEGAQAFYDMIEQERAAQALTCEQAKNNSYGITAEKIIRNTCAACHAGGEAHSGFIAADKSFIVQDANYLRTIFSRVVGLEQPIMPQNGEWSSPANTETYALQKKVLTCFLTEQAEARGVVLPTATEQVLPLQSELKFLHSISGEGR